MNLLEYFKGKKLYSCSHSDLDGFGSTCIVEYYLVPISEVLYLNTYEYDMSEVNMEYVDAAQIILFTDFAPTLELYETLISKGKEVFIFDHHKTARDELGEHPNYYYDSAVCGTKIFYDELTKGIRINRVLDRFVHLVNTYDMFNFESKDWVEAKGLSNAMFGYPNYRIRPQPPNTEKFLRFISVQMMKFTRMKSFVFTQEEKSYIEEANKKEQKYFLAAKKKLVVRTDSEENRYAFFSAPSKLSFIAHRLLHELSTPVDYLIAYSSYKIDGVASTHVSLRSRKGEFDVSKIAEKYGGGGHQPAASVDLKDVSVVNDLKNGKIHLI